MNVRRRICVLAALFVLCVSQPLHAQIAARLEFSAIRDNEKGPAFVRASYVAALNMSDPDALRRLYADDALAVFGDGRVHRGAEHIATRVRAALAADSGRVQVTIQPLAFVREGDIASERGLYVVSRGSGDNVQTCRGIYVVIYTRRGGDWRIAMEVRTTGAQPSLVDW